MSNVYCTVAQLSQRFDLRALGMLSNDDNSRDPVTETLQAHLDDAASELDAHLATWTDVPLTVPIPSVLTRWVAITAVRNLYGRRADMPKAITEQMEWADNWVEKWKDGSIRLPSVDRQVQQVTLDTTKAQRLGTGPYGMLTEGSRVDPDGTSEDTI